MKNNCEKISLLLALLLLFGCEQKKQETHTKVDNEQERKMASIRLEEERERNMAIVNSTVINSETNQNSLPKFALSCAFGPFNQNNSYRFVSEGDNIYFGLENGTAMSKSNKIEVTEREIRFQQLDPEGGIYSMNKKTEIRRDTLKVWVTRVDFTGKDEEQVYICENIEDDNIIYKIKADYILKNKNADDRKRQYDSRPNKI